ncbi:MAG: hypothetical protein ACW99A_10335 [Candidatus Kariarchaeaceae archaeon]
MKPKLSSVIAIDIFEDTTEVEITYLGSELLAGIDLHGVDAGLSWLKDKGIAFKLHESEERMVPYSVIVKIEESCEFRARSYIIDEDYWESNNHKIIRNEDGSISLETDEETLDQIKFVSSPPNPFSPHIVSIILKEVKENSSLFSVKYQTNKRVTGIELHGVDGGLSWLKGESIEMTGENGSSKKFTGDIEVIHTVEFKARAYNDRGDHWEEGENHKVLRRLDGTIGIEDDFVLDENFEFIWILPLDKEPSLETVFERLSLENDIPPSLFQYLIDTSIWFSEYYKDPLNQDLFDLVSRMMRYIREKQREIASHKIDKFINPIFKALYAIYTSAISFIDDDIDELKEDWKQEGLITLFEEIPNNIEKFSIITLHSSEDREKRTRELWEFN